MEFDGQFGISTGGSIAVASVHDGESLYYEATAPYAFSAMISRLPAGLVAQSTFVDVGCGRGRTLIMAAECGFRHIEGIELARELYLDACQNVARYQSSRGTRCTIKVENIDACEYKLPDSVCVLFLYNTLGPNSTRRFVSLVEQSLARNPRDLIVVYHNSEWRRIWDESPWFSRLAADIWSPDWYVIYRAVWADTKAAASARD